MKALKFLAKQIVIFVFSAVAVTYIFGYLTFSLGDGGVTVSPKPYPRLNVAVSLPTIGNWVKIGHNTYRLKLKPEFSPSTYADRINNAYANWLRNNLP